MGVSIADSRASFSAVAHVLLQRDSLSKTPSAEPEFLLMRRAGTGFMDGYYGLPGGHVEVGELPAAAAKRECLEEAGVVVGDLQPLAVLPYRSASDGRTHTGFNFLFVASRWQGQAHIAEPGQCDVLCWAPARALPRPYPGWLDAVLDLNPSAGWYKELDYTTG